MYSRQNYPNYFLGVNKKGLTPLLCVSGSIIESTWSVSLMGILLTRPPFTLSMSWLWPAGDTVWRSDRGTEKTREHTLSGCLRWADTVLSSVNKHDDFFVHLSNSFFAFHICRNSWMMCLWVTRSLARSENIIYPVLTILTVALLYDMSCEVNRMLNTVLPCSQCDVVAHICTMHTLVYVFFFL